MAEKTVSNAPNRPVTASTDEAYRQIGEVIIELGDDRCRNFMWPPTRETLRGAWKRGNLFGITMHTTMSEMPDIPGQCIVVDGRKRQMKTLDPLNIEANAALLAKIKAVYREMFRLAGGPAKDVTEEGCNDTRLKTALWWMRRFVDNKQARVVSGNLPTLAVIEELPGRINAEMWNSSARARKYREDEPEYTE
jgi:hypothetical protein